MSLSTVASVRSEVVAAREEETSDLERYLTLQRLVDALDRVYATLQLLEAAPAGCTDGEISETAAELEAAVASAGVLGPVLQQRVAAVARVLDDAAARVAPRTRVARRSVSAPAEVRRSVRGGMLGASEPATPLPNVSPALFGASAPSAVAPGARFAAHFVAYAEGAEASARALLAEAQGDAHIVTEAGGDPLATGTVVEVALSGAGSTVEGQPRDVQRFVWTGRTKVLGFEVELAAATTSTVLRYDVMVDGIVLARIRLPVEISERTKPESHRTAQARFAKSAFASYSSKDRERVIDRVAAIRIAAKVDVFLDCHDLNPGEAWEPRLAQAIDGCDTFLLFWSDAAAQSRWVQWEWKRALQKPGPDSMQFHPLENGVKPPPDLAAIHLGDPYMDLRAAERVRRATAATTREAT